MVSIGGGKDVALEGSGVYRHKKPLWKCNQYCNALISRHDTASQSSVKRIEGRLQDNARLVFSLPASFHLETQPLKRQFSIIIPNSGIREALKQGRRRLSASDVT